MSYSTAAATYRRNAILTASPEKLIVLLYEGAIRHLERIRIGLSDPTQRHSEQVGLSFNKAIGIIAELRTSLDAEKGKDVAQNLDALYGFCLDQLSDANAKRELEPIENALSIMRTLKEGWDAVIPN